MITGIRELNSKKELHRAYVNSFISHSAIKGNLKYLFEQENGWKNSSKSKKINGISVPDMRYTMSNGDTIQIEIKPKNAKLDEIYKAIGQLLVYSLEDKHAMIVCHNKWEELLTQVYDVMNVERLHLLCYDNNGNFKEILPKTKVLSITLVESFT